jgi:membrane protein
VADPGGTDEDQGRARDQTGAEAGDQDAQAPQAPVGPSRARPQLPPAVTGAVTGAVGSVRSFLDRSRRDAVDQLAAGIAYFAFLALVPLLLLATALAGFLLDDPEAQATVARAITGALPGLDAAVLEGGPLDALLGELVRRRTQFGVIGAVSLLLIGLRLAASLMAGVEIVFRVDRQKGVRARLRQTAALLALGAIALVGFAVSGGVSGLVSSLGPWLPGPLAVAVTFGVSSAFDVLLFLVAYRVLLPRNGWLLHLPGALVGAAGWAGLKVFGATVLGIRLQSAGAVYGTLAGVATVLVLLYVMARLFLTGAVLSAVWAERRAERQA